MFYPVVMSFMGRWFGGGFFDAPKGLKKAIWGVLCGLFVYLVLGFHSWYGGSIFIFVTLGSGLLSNMGHADFFYGWKGTREQTASPLARFIYGAVMTHLGDKIHYLKRQGWVYDAIGMIITGVAAVIVPAGVLLAHGHITAGLVLLIAGSFKAVSYILSPEFGEFGRGATVGLAMQYGLNG